MFFLTEVYDGTNRDTFNLMPWYETTRRLDGERFPPRWGPPRIVCLNVAEANLFLAYSNHDAGDGPPRIVRAIGPAIPHTDASGDVPVTSRAVTIIYQERLPNGHDAEPDAEASSHTATSP